jgi:hypothetical protein
LRIYYDPDLQSWQLMRKCLCGLAMVYIAKPLGIFFVSDLFYW